MSHQNNFHVTSSYLLGNITSEIQWSSGNKDPSSSQYCAALTFETDAESNTGYPVLTMSDCSENKYALCEAEGGERVATSSSSKKMTWLEAQAFCDKNLNSKTERLSVDNARDIYGGFKPSEEFWTQLSVLELQSSKLLCELKLAIPKHNIA